VFIWGEGPHGGNSSAVDDALGGSVVEVVQSRFAFAARRSDGNLVAWGVQGATANAGLLEDSTDITTVVANEGAFVAVENGALVGFGSRHLGGAVQESDRCSGACPGLTAVVNVAASSGAFAALMDDGTVYVWGSRFTGGQTTTDTQAALVNVTQVVAAREAFAVLRGNGSVVAWGSALFGGDTSSVSSELQEGVLFLTSSRTGFSALKANGKLVLWGFGRTGGDASTVAAQLSDGVLSVAYTFVAAAAVKEDGSVVAWGHDVFIAAAGVQFAHTDLTEGTVCGDEPPALQDEGADYR
jgi:alpha-tubulin suppressor-like RCC1 family protein